ncbi:hypothetical protein MKEN_01135400 [Mycena kentingensis (nom. inval.)]|nr:hypothetical protein MKEN_01135400 [Mycena kentingensis (nom. inval.)]
MAQPPSPFPSSSSSTLLMTPPPIQLHVPAQAKGPIQPHFSNLPRKPRVVRVAPPQSSPNKTPRRKGVSAMDCAPPTLKITAPGLSRDNTSYTSDESRRSQYAMSPIAIPLLPPIPLSPGAQTRHPHLLGASLPAPGHVSRSRSRTPPSGVAGVVQRLGRAANIVISLVEPNDGVSDADAVVQIHSSESDSVVEDCSASPSTLRIGISSPPRDDGVPRLLPAQLHAVGVLIRKVAVHRQRRIAVVAPSDEYSTEAFAMALSAYYSEGDFPDLESIQGLEGFDAEPSRLRRLVWRWHDLPEESIGGLSGRFRGLLSCDGLDWLVSALEKPPLCSLDLDASG